jgi:hypothetical protein
VEPPLLDACVAINLVASGVPLDDLAASAGVRFTMTSVAAAETLYLAPDRASGERMVIDLSARSLDIVELDPDELASFVELAAQVDDGEAATLAVAIHRHLEVATDDRRGSRLAKEHGIAVVTTASLVRRWANDAAAPAAAIAAAVDAIRRCASFIPPRSDPDYDWWCGMGGPAA